MSHKTARRRVFGFLAPERAILCLLPPPPRSCSHHVRVGLGSEVKGRDIGAAQAARDWSCLQEQHSSHDPGVRVGVHSEMESRSRALRRERQSQELMTRLPLGMSQARRRTFSWSWDRVFGGLDESWPRKAGALGAFGVLLHGVKRVV